MSNQVIVPNYEIMHSGNICAGDKMCFNARGMFHFRYYIKSSVRLFELLCHLPYSRTISDRTFPKEEYVSLRTRWVILHCYSWDEFMNLQNWNALKWCRVCVPKMLSRKGKWYNDFLFLNSQYIYSETGQHDGTRLLLPSMRSFRAQKTRIFMLFE